MAIISLYGNTVGGSLGSSSFSSLGNAFNTAKQSTNNLTKKLGTLRTKINAINGSVNLSSSSECVTKSIKREEQKQGNLSLAYDKLDQLISDTSAVDSKAAAKVEEIKSDFYAKYSYLKPTSEYNWWDWTKEGVKALWNGICSFNRAVLSIQLSIIDWCKKNWKTLLKIIVVIALVVLVVVVAVLLIVGVAVAPWLVCICVFIAIGMVASFVGNAISNVLSGKSLFEGSLDALFYGGISGSIDGMLFAFCGLSGPGATAISSFITNSLKYAMGDYEGDMSYLEFVGINVLTDVLLSFCFDKLFNGLGSKLNIKLGDWLNKLDIDKIGSQVFKAAGKTAGDFVVDLFSSTISETINNVVNNTYSYFKSEFGVEGFVFVPVPVPILMPLPVPIPLPIPITFKKD